MGTPITFSGFNDIDFNLVLNSLMAQASVPLNALQTRQDGLRSHIKSLDAMASHVAALRSAAATLTRPANLAMISGTSSDPSAVSVSAGASAAPGSLDIIVNTLARAQVTASASTAPDANATVVASGGSLTIGGTTVAIAGDVTMQQLADAINATDGIGVRAAVVRTGPSAYRLALTGLESGAAHAFTITNGLTGGSGLTFTDTDNNGVSGDQAADNAVSASDASLLVNNIAVTSSSNQLDELLPGVSITVAKADPAATVHVEVATDASSLKTDIQEFVTVYNAFLAFVGEQRSAAAGGDADSLGRDPVLRALRNDLRMALTGAHGTAALTRLAEAGVELTQSGELKLNEAALDAAVAADPDAIRGLFGAADGAFSAMGDLLATYTQADGIIPEGKKQLEHQIATMDEQIAAMQRRLAIERESLQKQFAEADLIMSRLKAQAGSLASFGSGFGSL